MLRDITSEAKAQPEPSEDEINWLLEQAADPKNFGFVPHPELRGEFTQISATRSIEIFDHPLVLPSALRGHGSRSSA